MRKLFSLLLALCLAVGVLPCLAEAEGEELYGFTVKETREFPMLGATMTLLEHQRTGAQMIYIANDDTNRVFDLTFFTDAIDNTGLPHVFEHATLGGSEKYPSRDIFFNLSYQTYNTYMNAMTASRMTTYPVASLSEAQLLKYADFYTDSCFHPLIMQDESIYREEAWRYRLNDAESPLTIEGTVYSEMLGAMDMTRSAYTNFLRSAFPGSTIGNVSGGDPAFIPDMTYESLRGYHDLYYHPSNCVAYLYGQFEDYTAFLKLLDEAFAPYERKEFVHQDPAYTAITAPATDKVAYPVEATSNTENGATVYYGFVVHGADEQQVFVLDTMTDLLTANGSALRQQIREALPSGDFGVYIEIDGPEPAICFYVSNVPEDSGEVFRSAVDAALADVAANGFPQELVDSNMATLSLQISLSRENSDIGKDMVYTLASTYAATGNPWYYADYVDALSQMDDWNQKGAYAEAAAAFLAGSETTALVTTYPEPGLKETQDAALAERLAEVKAGMSDEEIEALIASSAETDAKDDNAEMVASLQAVTTDSLPEELKEYDIKDETVDRVRYIDVTAAVDGVGQPNIFLNADFLAQDDIQWFKLYTLLLGEVDTSAHTKAELATLTDRYLSGKNIRVSLLGHGNDYQSRFRMSWTARDEDLDEGYDLAYELAFDTQFDRLDQVLAQVQSRKASMKADITSAPYNTILFRAFGRESLLDRYYSYTTGTDFYTFLEEVEAQLQGDSPETVTERLNAVQEQLRNRSGAAMIFAGNEESIALNRTLEDAFLARLENTETETAVYDLPVCAASEALVVDSNVQFNGLAADYAALGLDGYDAGLDVITALVSDLYLYPQLRDQYGAYGVMHGAMVDEGIYVISYRDPNVRETFAVYDALAEQIAALEVSQDTLDGYILSSYATYAKPTGELSGAVETGLKVLQGDPLDENLTRMRQIKAVTPEKVRESASLYTALAEKGVVVTAGGAGVISENADLYEIVLNPFGAVDSSTVAFTDVPEDHPAYAAVRFAFENGLMAPAAEDAFGAEENAVNGDMVGALYVLIGGGLNPEEGLTTLAGYGLLSPDLDLAGELTDTSAMEMVANLMAAVGEPMEAPETEGKVLTRADLAALLQELFDEE